MVSIAQQKRFYAHCLAGNVDAVKRLVDLVDVNWAHPGRQRRTALHAACLGRHPEVVRLLLALHQIDVLKVDATGKDALWHACWQEDPRSIALILAHPDLQNSSAGIGSGQAALWRAARCGIRKVVNALLAGHARLDAEQVKRLIIQRQEAVSLTPHYPEIETNLGMYAVNPRRLARMLNGTPTPTPSAELFAQLVFVCEGLLAIEGE